MPALDMSVGKGQVGALLVAVGGQVKPVIGIITVGRKNAEGCISNILLLRVNKDK